MSETINYFREFRYYLKKLIFAFTSVSLKIRFMPTQFLIYQKILLKFSRDSVLTNIVSPWFIRRNFETPKICFFTIEPLKMHSQVLSLRQKSSILYPLELGGTCFEVLISVFCIFTNDILKNFCPNRSLSM